MLQTQLFSLCWIQLYCHNIENLVWLMIYGVYENYFYISFLFLLLLKYALNNPKCYLNISLSSHYKKCSILLAKTYYKASPPYCYSQWSSLSTLYILYVSCEVRFTKIAQNHKLLFCLKGLSSSKRLICQVQGESQFRT